MLLHAWMECFFLGFCWLIGPNDIGAFGLSLKRMEPLQGKCSVDFNADDSLKTATLKGQTWYAAPKGTPLGKGKNGTAYRVRKEGALRVLKVVRIDNNSNTVNENVFLYEVGVMQHLKDKGVQNVAQLDRWCVSKSNSVGLILMTDFEGTDLLKVMKSGAFEFGKKEKHLAMIFSKVITIVNDIHHAKVIHRDIKPDNILVKKWESDDVTQLEVEVIDFDVAVVSARKNPQHREQSLTSGTADYY